jgi:hypothetical protein
MFLLFLAIEISSFAPTTTTKTTQNYPRCEFSWHLYGKRQKARFNSKQPFRKRGSSIQDQLLQAQGNNAGNGTDHHVVLMVDANNVRGSEGFQLTTYDLIRVLASWRRSMISILSKDNNNDNSSSLDPHETGKSMSMSVSILCMMDHGGRPNAFSLDGIMLVFAGPNRTADDVMVQDCQWLAVAAAEQQQHQYQQQQQAAGKQSRQQRLDLFVVTNDRQLRSRCLGSNRPTYIANQDTTGSLSTKEASSNSKLNGNGIIVQVFDSLPFSNLLKTHWREEVMVSPLAPEVTTLATEQINHTRTDQQAELWNAISKVESDLRSYQRPPLLLLNRRKRRRQGKVPPAVAAAAAAAEQQQSNDECRNVQDRHPLGADEFPEKTWQRVLVAERLRQMLFLAAPSSPSALKNEESVVVEAADATTDEHAFFWSSYQAMHNRIAGPPVNLCYDQRIRHDNYAQDALSRYLADEEKSTK